MRTLLRTTFASLVAWAARLVRRTKRIVVAVSVALCAVILALGWLSYRSVKEVVTEDFNQQQLVLAKYAARQSATSWSCSARSCACWASRRRSSTRGGSPSPGASRAPS